MDVSVNGQPFLSNLIFLVFFVFCLVTLIFKRWGSVFPVLNNRGIEGNGALGNFGGIIESHLSFQMDWPKGWLTGKNCNGKVYPEGLANWSRDRTAFPEGDGCLVKPPW